MVFHLKRKFWAIEGATALAIMTELSCCIEALSSQRVMYCGSFSTSKIFWAIWLLNTPLNSSPTSLMASPESLPWQCLTNSSTRREVQDAAHFIGSKLLQSIESTNWSTASSIRASVMGGVGLLIQYKFANECSKKIPRPSFKWYLMQVSNSSLHWTFFTAASAVTRDCLLVSVPILPLPSLSTHVKVHVPGKTLSALSMVAEEWQVLHWCPFDNCQLTLPTCPSQPPICANLIWVKLRNTSTTGFLASIILSAFWSSTIFFADSSMVTPNLRSPFQVYHRAWCLHIPVSRSKLTGRLNFSNVVFFHCDNLLLWLLALLIKSIMVPPPRRSFSYSGGSVGAGGKGQQRYSNSDFSIHQASNSGRRGSK